MEGYMRTIKKGFWGRMFGMRSRIVQSSLISVPHLEIMKHQICIFCSESFLHKFLGEALRFFWGVALVVPIILLSLNWHYPPTPCNPMLLLLVCHSFAEFWPL